MNLRYLIISILICTSLTGCASVGIYRSFSKINNEPIEEIKSTEILENGLYRLCVIGKLRNNGYGEYQISIPKDHIINSGFSCRNNKLVRKNNRYYCADDDFTVYNILTKNEEVFWGCQIVDENKVPKYRALITGQDPRTIKILDSENQAVSEIYVAEIWEGTNPVVYLFMPVTVAFDVVTFPLQAWFGLAMALGR